MSSTSSTFPTLSPPEAAISSATTGPPGTKRIMMLHVAAGAGHERAARAVAAALERIRPGTVVDVRDALEFSSRFLRTTYASTYNQLLAKAPRVWGQVYKRTASPHDSYRQKIRTWLAVWGSPKYLEAIEAFQPDAIFCTQFLPAEVLAEWREEGKVHVPVVTAITDFAVHPIWVHRGMDHYFVAADSVKEELVDTEMVPASRVSVTGIPIDPKFAMPLAAHDARLSLGLDPDPSRLTLLLMGGGHGWGPIGSMLDVVLALPSSVQALVVAGKNTKLRDRLIAKTAGVADRVKVHGFTNEMERFLAASDVIVSKTGGLTVSEALAMGTPIVVFRPLPGQEERNCDFLQESGAGVRVHDHEELHFRLKHFLHDPHRLAAMKAMALRLGHPRSAFTVAESLLQGFPSV